MDVSGIKGSEFFYVKQQLTNPDARRERGIDAKDREVGARKPQQISSFELFGLKSRSLKAVILSLRGNKSMRRFYHEYRAD